ncbi:MAG: hypothetical protein KDC07_07605 [Chitinophagaceae bacterium]|nr:hypothetical protein [Chitinophagaceae bacterium]
MLKRVLSLFPVLFYTITLPAQDAGELPVIKAVKDYDVAGPVKSLYEITYAVSFQNRTLLDSTVYLDTILSRNKETNVAFDTLGRLLSDKVDSFDADGKTILSHEVVYHYNADKLAGILHYTNGDLLDSTYIEYNRKEEVEKLISYDHKGRLTKTIQYFYRNGNIFNIKIRNDENLLVNFIRYKYDLTGKLTEQEINGSTMQYIHSYKYKYDTLKDGTTQMNKYDYIGRYKYRSLVQHLYDTKGQLIQMIVTDSNRRVTENHTMKYTPTGLLRSELVFTRFKNEYTYHYEYDDAGNWKTKYLSVNDKYARKTHRVKELYKKQDEE